MKKRLLPLIAGLIFLATTPAAAGVQEGIAAIVNDSVITITDIKERADLYTSGSAQPNTPAQRTKVEQQVLGRLIDEALQLQEAQKLGISVSEEDINNGFAEVARQNGMSPDDLKKKLAHDGAPVRSLRNQLKANIAWSQVVRRKLRPQINISEKEIDFAVKQADSGKDKPQYNVAEIFLKVPDPAQEDKVKNDAAKLVKQMTDGASFSSIAREFSQAPGASTGGDLGWVQEGQLDPALDRALREMHPGQITPPVRSALGYHILFLKETRANNVTAAAPAAQGVLVTLKQIFIPVTEKDGKTVVAAKTARAKTLKKEITSCDTMSARMKDFPSPNTGDLGTGPQDGLPPDVRATVEKLKVNELSEPIRTPDGISLLMVCDRTDAAAAPETAQAGDKDDPEASRNKIANSIGLKRLDKMANHYLNDLRATAFIDKRI